MLHIWQVSGEELATIPAKQLSSVKALKRSLQHLCGFSRFRQRLLHNGSALDDMSTLEGDADLQLVLLPFVHGSKQADELADAAGNGLVSVVEELLQRPLNPDSVDQNGETPLYRACLIDSADTARLLLEAGADKDLACGQHHLTALVVASGLGHLDTVRVLLQAGADQEMCCDGLCGSDQGSDLLREAGIDEGRIEAICGPDGVTALGAAASHGHLDTMRLLLESKSYTALHV